MKDAIDKLHNAHTATMDYFESVDKKHHEIHSVSFLANEAYRALNELLSMEEFYDGLPVDDIVAANATCRILAEKIK